MGTTHASRHGRVSVLRQNGVPGDLINRWVGHSSLKTTSKYSRFTKEFSQGDRFETRINGPDDGPIWTQLEASNVLM